MYRMNLYKPNKYLYEAFKYTVKLNAKKNILIIMLRILRTILFLYNL